MFLHMFQVCVLKLKMNRMLTCLSFFKCKITLDQHFTGFLKEIVLVFE